ncbi:MAG TPA: ATP-binding protein [Allosphingosinicella sp.]
MTNLTRQTSPRLFRGLIWLFCLLLAGGTWWVVLTQIGFERRQAIDDGIRQNENRAIAFEQFVRRTLEAADLVTNYVGGRFARGNAASEFEGTPEHPYRIQGSVARSGTFLGIAIADEHGDVVASSRGPPISRLNVAAHPGFAYHVARDTRRLHVAAPTPSILLPGRNVVWLSRRLNRPDGSFAGVIAVIILPEQFTAFYRDARVGPHDVMSVIGLDGIARARRNGNVSTSGEDFRGRALLTFQQTSPDSTHVGPSTLDGITRLYSQRRIRGYDLFVAYGVPEAEILAPSRSRARIILAGAALVSLVILAFVAFITLYLSRRDRLLSEMARANQRLQEAQRIGQIGDWDYDLKTGKTIWSPQLLAMYGLETSPTLDQFMAFLDDEGRKTVERAHADAIGTGEAQQIEYAVRLVDGEESYHQSAVIPTFDGAGKVVGLHGVDQNVSARMLLERLQAHVAHLSRADAMNAMAATLAHELNQPLTAASNFLVGSRRRLKADLPGAPAEVEGGMVAAEQQVHLAGNIIRRVREMLSNQPKTVAPVSVPRVVDDAVVLVSMASAESPLRLSKHIAPDAVRVMGDRIQIQQVLINLIRNAADAIVGMADGAITVLSRRDGAHIVISVCDNGPGFTQPDGERFSPFSTTKTSGLGLGLSISRTIIESHGGRIWTEDLEGRGARVSFSLPAPPQGEETESDEAAYA